MIRSLPVRPAGLVLWLLGVVFILCLVFGALPGSAALHAGEWAVADRHNRQADLLLQQKRYDEALAELRLAETEWPDGGHYATRQGWVRLWPMKDAAGALTHFERALAQGGLTNPWTLRDRGNALCQLERYAEADRSFREAVQAARSRGAEAADELVHSLGWASVCKMKQGEYGDAIALADEGLGMQSSADRWALAEGKIHSELWLAHRAFAGGDYDDAIRHYAAVERAAQLSPLHREWLRELDPALHRGLAEKRKALGRIRPEYVHRILVVRIRHSRLDFKGLKGERIQTVRSISDFQRERSQLFLELLRAEIEAMSGGRLSLSFDTEELDAALTELRSTSFGPVETRQPVFETIAPSVGGTYCRAAQKYDTIWTFWEGEGAATTANGGGLPYPCIAYQLYTPVRGYVSFPINWNGPDAIVAYLHEFFHNVEAMAGIEPTHGFQGPNRSRFPGWRGNGQMDYFQWHFAATLPRVANDPALANAAPSYRNLNYLYRQPDRNTDAVIAANETVTARLSRDDLREARRLSDEASELHWNRHDAQSALAKARLSLAKNPYQRDALMIAALVSADRKDHGAAVGYFRTLAPLNPEPWILKYLAHLQQWETKDLAGAIETYRSLEALYGTSPEIAEIYPAYGRALMETGRNDEALGVLERGRHRQAKEAKPPVAAQCSFWKGYVLGEKLSRPAEALPLVQEAWDGGYRDSFVEFYVKKYRSGDVAQRALFELPQPERPAAPVPARSSGAPAP